MGFLRSALVFSMLISLKIVSRIFYRYRESDTYEETLGDQPVEGEVVARRTVAIVDGQLRKVTAPQGTFVREGDAWRRAASHNLL